MPIDASIALGVKPMQVKSQGEYLNELYNQQNAEQTNQLNQMKMDEYKRGLTEDEAIKNALTRLDRNSPTYEQDRFNAYALKGIEGVKAYAATKKEEAAAEEHAIGTTGKKLSNVKEASAFHRDNLWGVTDSLSAAAWVENLYKDATIGSSLNTMIPKQQMLASIPTDPAQLANWKTQVAMGSKEFAKESIAKPTERATNTYKELTDTNPVSPTYGQVIPGSRIEMGVSPNTTATINAAAEQGRLNRANAEKVAKLRNSGDLTDEQNLALYGPNGAVTTGKLDPYKISSRNSHILANAYLSNPNTDMNKLASDAAMMRNPPTMNRAYTTEQLPTIISNVVDAGKKVNYSDAKFFGKVQEFINGQSNDPDFINYMTQRNDALLTITSIMRGNGATDQAHRAEIEASPSTMSPKAFDAWAAGQMKALEPRLKQANKFTRTQPAPATTTAPAVKNIPLTNAKGWALHTDANNNKAYVGPNGEIDEVK